ncbi:MAG: hypothetical protein OEZ43_07515 [Gammaproteobacteria bacterium]|nr:hypothetical protein [Gammaproteobacteria bacterium]
MPTIPSSINSVVVEFANSVNKDVAQVLINGLNHCIKADVASGFTLDKIYISSAKDSHTLPSRHMQSKAVDISRVNGTKIAIGYPQGGAIKAIVDAIQDSFESFASKRENFGPHLKKKLGNNYSVSGHNDHIHISVN